MCVLTRRTMFDKWNEENEHTIEFLLQMFTTHYSNTQ